MNTLDFFHGAILLKVVNNGPVNFKKYPHNNSSYIIDDKIGIYCKYSQKRISPWVFSFSKAHTEEINKVKNEYKDIFIVLVCNDNGICCLNFQEFCTVISIESNYFPKWIKARRQKREKYAITGSDGKLNYKIGDSDFPEKIYQ